MLILILALSSHIVSLILLRAKCFLDFVNNFFLLSYYIYICDIFISEMQCTKIRINFIQSKIYLPFN